jgi:hypothetical protein
MRTEDFVYLYEVEDKLWWFAGMRAISAALLDEFCPPVVENILDIGCGSNQRAGRRKNGAGFLPRARRELFDASLGDRFAFCRREF